MENDYYSDGEHKSKSKIGKILRLAALSLAVLVYGLIFFRIFIKSDPESAKMFLWTDTAVQAYKDSSDTFGAYTQKLSTYQRQTGTDENGIPEYTTVSYNDITSDGSFHVSNMIYVSSTKELTVTVRYNRTAVDALKSAYNLDSLPSGELFFFALEGVGADGSEYAYEYRYTSSARFTYEYRRLVFSNVVLPDDGVVYLNVYYVDDVTLSSPLVLYPDSENNSVTVTLPIYDSYIGLKKYDFEKYLPAEKTDGLKNRPYASLK